MEFLYFIFFIIEILYFIFFTIIYIINNNRNSVYFVFYNSILYKKMQLNHLIQYISNILL